LATRGASQSLSFELSVPASDLQFGKLIYNGQIFFPLSRTFTLRLRTQLGYGDGYGDQRRLPFYQNFYSGGFGSVRGYKSNTLGPRSTPAIPYQRYVALDENGNSIINNFSYLLVDQFDPDATNPANSRPTACGTSFNTISNLNGPKVSCERFDVSGDPFGGNILVEGGAEILFPLPFIKDQSSVRTAFFFDVGNVFSSDCGNSQVNCSSPDFNELRYSVGAGLTWITGFGPLTFSYAIPYNDAAEDRTEEFQFSLGRSF
jgi:outer membrane protein insertion porin family